MLNILLSSFRLWIQGYNKNETTSNTSDRTDDTLEEAPPLSESVPQPILAFRTATIVLSQLLKGKILPDPRPKLTLQQTRELKVADAFAHIAATGCGAVAVSTHISPSSLKIVALTTGNPQLPIPNSSMDTEMDIPRQLGSDKMDSGSEDKTLSHVIASTHKAETGGQTLESKLRELQKAWCV